MVTGIKESSKEAADDMKRLALWPYKRRHPVLPSPVEREQNCGENAGGTSLWAVSYDTKPCGKGGLLATSMGQGLLGSIPHNVRRQLQ